MAGILCGLVLLCTSAAAFELRLLQWNPHWECSTQSWCQGDVREALHHVLPANNIDFANVVELAGGYNAPYPFVQMVHTCGRDRVSLLYNSQRWQVSRAGGSIEVGCMEMNDRPFQMQVFEELGNHGRRVLVIGAHFTHYSWYSSVRRAIARVTTATGVEHTILIADTNVDASTSTRTLMSRIGVPWASRSVDSDLHRTCCLNDGFTYTFDRISANFGSSLETSILYETPPAWAMGAFHKGVLATLHEPQPSFMEVAFTDPAAILEHLTLFAFPSIQAIVDGLLGVLFFSFVVVLTLVLMYYFYRPAFHCKVLDRPSVIAQVEFETNRVA